MIQLKNRPRHDCQDLIGLFNTAFSKRERTLLQSGGMEPVYRPARGRKGYHKIIFTQDYYASALHEMAHWGVAGVERRQEDDYGYWYAPDGRSPLQQREFEQVEVKPQALEWVLAEACGFRFRVSADNLEQGLGASENFKNAIYERALLLCKQKLNDRMQILVEALLAFYQPTISVAELLNTKHFQRRVL